MADKTKANWFAYEFANEVYDVISELFKNKDCGISLNHHDIEKLSISIAKATVKILRSFKNGVEPVTILSTEAEDQILNSLDKKTFKDLENVVNKCFDSQLNMCELCSTECIYDLDGICDMFDEDFIK